LCGAFPEENQINTLQDFLKWKKCFSMGFLRRERAQKIHFGEILVSSMYVQQKVPNKHTARFFEMEKELC